jgi:hypothetical protein
MLSLDDKRMIARYLEARRQRLSITGESGIYFVSSFKSRPGGFHKVVIEGNEGSCSCPAILPCTHLALAAYEDGVMIFTGSSDEAFEGYYQMRARILSDSAYRERVERRYASELIAA